MVFAISADEVFARAAGHLDLTGLEDYDFDQETTMLARLRANSPLPRTVRNPETGGIGSCLPARRSRAMRIRLLELTSTAPN